MAENVFLSGILCNSTCHTDMEPFIQLDPAPLTSVSKQGAKMSCIFCLKGLFDRIQILVSFHLDDRQFVNLRKQEPAG